MKKLSPRWACLVQPPRNPRLPVHATIRHTAPFSHDSRAAASRRIQQPRHQWHHGKKSTVSRRSASTAAAPQLEQDANEIVSPERPALRVPSHRRALQSAKLAALHARLSLPSKLPLQTLARCLIDPSVDPRRGYNNAPFALLGKDLLGYHTTEWLLCHYPRLPMPVLFTAQFAYIGPQTLATMREEWGVEVVAAPGPEVDPGLLQLTRMTPGNAMSEDGMTLNKDLPSSKRINAPQRKDLALSGRGTSNRIVYNNEFGELTAPSDDAIPYAGAPVSTPAETTLPAEVSSPTETSSPAGTSVDIAGAKDASETSSQVNLEPARQGWPTTVEAASASFVRALVGALYVHAGAAATKAFHKDHILSRHLPLHKLFHFTYPTRDLSRLCAREGFEPPVARLISETGRYSRTPVFVVGVYSGNDKLGEGAGASLDEGRVRAAAAALQSWYLYSPPEEEVMLPSETEGRSGEKKRKEWKPQLIDIGEIVT